MSDFKLVIGCLCLNEMEWLPKWVDQHIDWPGCRQIVFVESADPIFASQCPDMVTKAGLSTDGTTEFLRSLAREDSRFIHIPHGWTTHDDPAENKTAARQRYLDVANEVEPDFVAIVDSDEMYMKSDQPIINETLASAGKSLRHYCFPFTHIWRPESIQNEPLFKYEVVGGFWEMAHTKFFRWLPGVRYDCHQRPTYPDGSDRLVEHPHATPRCIHMAFASDAEKRKAKHAYYRARGEGVNDHRDWYVASRSAYERWQPGDILPRGAEVREYQGPIPECFL